MFSLNEVIFGITKDPEFLVGSFKSVSEFDVPLLCLVFSKNTNYEDNSTRNKFISIALVNS